MTRIGDVWVHRPKDEVQRGRPGEPCFRLVVEDGKVTLGCWELGAIRIGSDIGVDVLWKRIS